MCVGVLTIVGIGLLVVVPGIFFYTQVATVVLCSYYYFVVFSCLQVIVDQSCVDLFHIFFSLFGNDCLRGFISVV